MVDRRGTYEVYIKVDHHPRHLEDWAARESTAFKLVDMGNPAQMVVNALRAFANELEEKDMRDCLEQAAAARRAEALAWWEERQRA